MIKKTFPSLFLSFLISFSPIIYPKNNSNELCMNKHVFGKIEKITLVDQHLTLNAKLDTGAEMSSLSANNVHIFKSKHKLLVSFLVKPTRYSKEIRFVEPLIRFVHIKKRKEEDGGNEFSARPVIKLPIAIGQQKKVILVNLVDRSGFQYPFLLGSDDLKKMNIIVDVSQKYLAPN